MLDIGSRIWYWGFSGEPSPRGMIDMGAPELWGLDCGRADWDETATEARVQAQLRRIFHRELMTDPRSRKVVVVESALLPLQIKAILARTLFSNLQVR